MSDGGGSSSEQVWTGLQSWPPNIRVGVGLVSGGGGLLQWGLRYHGNTPHPWTEWQTHENITFPQLRWQAVKANKSHTHTHQCLSPPHPKNLDFLLDFRFASFKSPPSPGTIFLHFHAVFRKKCRLKGWLSAWDWCPRLANPGSAAASAMASKL